MLFISPNSTAHPPKYCIEINVPYGVILEQYSSKSIFVSYCPYRFEQWLPSMSLHEFRRPMRSQLFGQLQLWNTVEYSNLTWMRFASDFKKPLVDHQISCIMLKDFAEMFPPIIFSIFLVSCLRIFLQVMMMIMT